MTFASAPDITAYLQEDIGTGDITAAIIPDAVQAEAVVMTREAMVVCGQPWVDAVFRAINNDIQILWRVARKQPTTNLLTPGAWRTIPFILMCWYVH